MSVKKRNVRVLAKLVTLARMLYALKHGDVQPVIDILLSKVQDDAGKTKAKSGSAARVKRATRKVEDRADA